MLLPLLIACSSPPAEQTPAEPAARPPDIVLVVVDTLRADHLGVYGHSRPTSPHIDALAREGAWYSRAYSSSSWTLPSFASLLTGLFPHQHLVVRDDTDPARFGVLQPEVLTLAEALKAQGYSTAAVMNNAFLAPQFHLDQGFDLYDWQGAWPTRHRSADDTVSAGLTWLNAQKGPSFLLLHFMEPHMAYAPPEDLRGTFAPKDSPPLPYPFVPTPQQSSDWMSGRFQPTDEVKDYMGRLYDEEILAVDRAVGTLSEGLHARGWEHTALVITADHGEEHWDHGGFEHGTTLYGELSRVPIIAAGAVPARGEVHTVVQHVDLVAGLLSLAGAPPLAGSRGVNLWSLSDKPGKPNRVALSEGVLYGEDAVSLVDNTSRVVLRIPSGLAEAWAVDEDGGERRRLDDAERERAAARLVPILRALRPDMGPLRVKQGAEVAGEQALDQLRALGYIDTPK